LSVDVDGEQYNVEQQTKAEFPVIVSKETQYGNEQAYEDAKNKVVFFQESHV
jgi:hypothetical protein